ncbi:MAG: hypothetical protein AB1646_03880 [Thermodesulfobacteriota bacterium]
MIPRLRELYRRMDELYTSMAGEMGFSCLGCDGAACCTVDLVLHTLVERLYLKRGFNTLDSDSQERIKLRAAAMVREKDRDSRGESYRNLVCVLNEAGLCVLYQFRPMICRLAGISHSFLRPDGREIQGDGCVVFQRDVHPAHPSAHLDRTPLYVEMASIEAMALESLRRSRQRPCTVSELFARILDSLPVVPE